MRAFLLSAALFWLGCGRLHPLHDGAYDFTAVEVIKDECSLVQKPLVVSRGVLHTTGHVVSLDYQLFDVELVGSYLSRVERMSLDGSAANVVMRVNDIDCLIDLATVHLDSTTRDPEHFDGTLSVQLDTRHPAGCVCELWLSYSATFAPSTTP